MTPSKVKVRLMNIWLEKVDIFEPGVPKWSKLGYIIFFSLLYDDLSNFFNGIFPSTRKMKDNYDFSCSLLLPYYRARRILNLLIKTVNT